VDGKIPRVLIGAVFAAWAPVATQADAAERRERWCTAAHINKVERKIGQIDSTARRTRAQMYLAMSKVARENDDRRGCMRHMEAVREVLGF
jgi:hypothetical protein